ncbi:MAG: hypothetical protein ACR2QK_10685 [Acidimicrobiales bacterium]
MPIAANSEFAGSTDPARPSPRLDQPDGWTYRTGIPERPRIGWSLAIASICQLIVAVVAINTGSTAIGVLSTASVAVGSTLIVGAEALARVRTRRRIEEELGRLGHGLNSHSHRDASFGSWPESEPSQYPRSYGDSAY